MQLALQTKGLHEMRWLQKLHVLDGEVNVIVGLASQAGRIRRGSAGRTHSIADDPGSVQVDFHGCFLARSADCNVPSSIGSHTVLEGGLSDLGDLTGSKHPSIRELADERINHWMQLKLPNLDSSFLKAGPRESSPPSSPSSHSGSSMDFEQERKQMRERMIKSFEKKAEQSTAQALSASQDTQDITFPTLNGVENIRAAENYNPPAPSFSMSLQATNPNIEFKANRLQASSLASSRKHDASASGFEGGRFESKASRLVNSLISKSLGETDENIKKDALNRIQAYHQATSSSSRDVIHYPGENVKASYQSEMREVPQQRGSGADGGESTSAGVQDHLFDLYTSNKNAQSYLNQDGGHHRGMAQLSAPASVAMASSRDDVDSDGNGGDPFNNALFNIIHDCSLGGPTC
eukprot:751398-Hanusia_phi.AAC.1